MKPTKFEAWTERWNSTIEAVGRVASKSDCRLEIQPAASLSDVKKVEAELGFSLPESFKEVLCDFSAGVNFFWFLREFSFSSQFDFIFRGDCNWDLQSLVHWENNRKRWIGLFEPRESYDVAIEIFQDKLVFMSVGNGDSIAIDLSLESYGKVIYLACHFDDEEGHGYFLGESFIDFIDRWTQIGCVGSEIWQMRDFTSGSTSYLEPDSDLAIQWRSTLGI